MRRQHQHLEMATPKLGLMLPSRAAAFNHLEPQKNQI